MPSILGEDPRPCGRSYGRAAPRLGLTERVCVEDHSPGGLRERLRWVADVGRRALKTGQFPDYEPRAMPSFV